jgi:hypothetical protein
LQRQRKPLAPASRCCDARRTRGQQTEPGRRLGPPLDDENTLWARPEASDALARDYLNVLGELLERIAVAEQVNATATGASAG